MSISFREKRFMPIAKPIIAPYPMRRIKIARICFFVPNIVVSKKGFDYSIIFIY